MLSRGWFKPTDGGGASNSLLRLEQTSSICCWHWGAETPTVTFSVQNTNLSSSASIPDQINKNDTESVSNWTSLADTNAQTGATFANTLASSLTLSGNAQATATTGGVGHAHHPVEALSAGSRSENFSFDAPGVLTVSIPYTISIAGGQQFNFFDSASAAVSGKASFNSFGSNGSPNSSEASFSLSSFEGPSPQSQSGNLVFDIVAAGPGSGDLELKFNLSTQAPVSPIPEPESYAMLLAGLGLIRAIAQHRTIRSIERV